MSFKKQLKNTAELRHRKIKKQSELNHKNWQQQNKELIDKIKAELLSVAGK